MKVLSTSLQRSKGLDKRVLWSKNTQFFRTPNLVNSYWAGFLAADGCVSPKQNMVSCRLNSRDEAHLQMLASSVNYNGRIDRRPNYGYSKGRTLCSVLTVCGVRDWVHDLKENFNVVERKSLILEPPTTLSRKCGLAYIIGYLDGDGSIFYQTTPWKVYLGVSVVGTKKVLVWIKKQFDVLIKPGPRVANVGRGKKGYQYRVTGDRALKILHKLDTIKTPRLERKWRRLWCWPRVVAR